MKVVSRVREGTGNERVEVRERRMEMTLLAQDGPPACNFSLGIGAWNIDCFRQVRLP